MYTIKVYTLKACDLFRRLIHELRIQEYRNIVINECDPG